MVELSRVAVIRNPRSGSALDTATLNTALRSVELDAPILDVPAGADLNPWLDELGRTHDVLVAAGGDGTVSAVAAAAARLRKTLAIIPTGTLNHFARDAGIPLTLDAAIAVLRRGRPRCVDIGVVNERVFLNNVSIGNYPRMVHERETLERQGRSRPVAAAIAIARTWWHLRKYSVWLTIDGQGAFRRSPFIVIGNGSYTLSGLALGTRDRISDGTLSLYVSPPTGRIGVLALPMRALVGSLERHEQFEIFGASTVRIAFRHQRLGVAIDGEVTQMPSPLEFSVRRRALRLLRPLDSRSGSNAAASLAQDGP